MTTLPTSMQQDHNLMVGTMGIVVGCQRDSVTSQHLHLDHALRHELPPPSLTIVTVP